MTSLGDSQPEPHPQQQQHPQRPPLTPKQTPASASTASFPSPAFPETPNLYSGAFGDHDHDHCGSQTPRFAEEYSVFNNTPGNLRRSPSPSGRFSPFLRPAQIVGHKRLHSIDSLSGDVAHVDLFQSAAPKPNTDLPLPPVEPSLQLASNGSPRPGLTAAAAAAAPRNKSPTPDQRASPNPSHQASGNPSGKPSSKQAANPSSPDPAAVTQTATPPPTARKDRRKPPKKLRMNHHGPQEFGQPDFTGASHQEFAGLMASPNELFSYPMSAPVSAPENFWDPSTMTLPMDMDFGADMFQPQHHHEPTGHGHHRQSSSFDWNNMFQEVAPQHTQPQQPQQLQQQQQPASMNHNANANQAKAPRRARALAPKPAAAPLQSSMSVNSLPVDNSFGIMGHHSNAGTVDPGILFSRPQTAAADSSFKAMIDDGSAEAALAGSAKAGMTGMPNGLRRSASARDTRMAGGNFPDRSFDTSPLKQGPSRPGLPRSQSDVRGRRPVSRPAMTTKNAVPSLDLSRVHTAPPATVSPLKKQQHRLSSLASIPESIPRPSSRASVKFYIGADGRAHAEAAEQPNLPPQAGPSVPAAKKNRSPSRSSVEINQWDEDYDSSSSDDEPIVIPSRTNSFTSLPSHSHSSSASFALPDPRRPVGSIFHPPSSKRGTVGPSDLHNNMLPRDMLRDGGDMSDDAETVMNDVQNDDGADAVSELLRVKENRQQAGGGSSKSQRFFSSSASAMYARGGYSNSVSPTRPGTANTMDGSVRCVCGRNDVPGFLVQCESCEMWQHGQCASQANQPGVYICAFCANMPSARGQSVGLGLGMASSPLANKSFRGLR